MRNINELIGIIEGINFDGIINDMEIDNLEKWINQNRNLVYETKQMELIHIVDMALKDKCITESEKNTILEYLNSVLAEEKDYEIIHELNGIIEGIICDGVINEEEIMHLNEWRHNHELKTIDVIECKKLYELIDSILEDGIITENEQGELLEYLDKKVHNSQFEVKLEYLKKQIKERKNIGIDLIDLLDNFDVINKIHSRAENQLKSALQSYSGISIMDPEIIVISLSIIAMLEYDGSFYDKVRKTYRELYIRFNDQRIEGLIRTILSKYRTEDDLAHGEKRIINVALYNSIVPRYYLGAFFDFIYDIYKLNFEYELPTDLYDEFKFVYEGLRSNMMSEGDDIKLNVTKKTYKLIKTSKQLIADYNSLDAIIKYSIIIVKLIDKKVWNKELKFHNPYLRSGYDDWCKHHEHYENQNRKKLSGIRSSWEPKFLIQDNNVYLVPPIHRVKAHHNVWEYFVQVLSDDKVIYETDHLEVTEIIAGFRISGEKILISDPLSNISYRLVAGNTIIYDSKKKLYRNYLVCNTDGFEIKNNTDYKGTAIFCYKGAIEGEKIFYKSKAYNLSSKVVKYGDSLFIAGDIFNFSSLQRPGVFGEVLDRHYLVEKESKNKISIYKQIKYLVFESETNYRKHEIIINDIIHDLSEFKTTITSREGVCKYVVDLPILKSGIYKLSVIEKKDDVRHKIATFMFAIDPSFSAEFNKLSDIEYAVSICSAFCEKSINICINANEYKQYITFLTYNMLEYGLMLPFELDLYRLSQEKWIPFSEELWIGDIKANTILDIHNYEIDEMIVYSSYGQQLAQLPLIDNCIYKSVDIGFLLSFKESFDYEVIMLLRDGKVKRAIFCNNKCILKESTEISYNITTNTLMVTPTYYGKGNIYFEIFNRIGESVYKSNIVEQNRVISITNLNSFERYKIVFFEKLKGLSLKKYREIKSFERSFFARKEFIGRSFKLSEVYYIDNNIKIKKSLPRTYIDIITMNEKGVFNGNIYWINESNHYVKLHIPNVEIEICSDVIDNTVELLITKGGKNLDMNTVFQNAPWELNVINTDIISYSAIIDC